MKYLKSVLSTLSLFIFLGSISSQNATINHTSKNVYLIKISNENSQNILSKEERKKLKMDILIDENFIYISKVSNTEIMLVSAHVNDIKLQTIEPLFSSYNIKPIILTVKEINNSTFNLSKLPILTTQDIYQYKESLLKWNNRITNQETIESIKTLFKNSK
ncbi:MAG: hypothetical protein COB15_12215 [Flavobacteriales bacterium]|nr:MAG: hypothetical protein COB15_12215 [Flavobacteriales bacterium]